MEAMRESWTDDRMDDLNGKVDGLRLEMRTEFKEVRGEMKEEFAAVRGEMKAGFDRVDERFDKVDERFDRISERFDRTDERFAKGLERIEERLDTRLIKIYQTMIWFCGIVLAALISVIAH
jgi:uncharacterized coiled-coil DUF342 family protein